MDLGETKIFLSFNAIEVASIVILERYVFNISVQLSLYSEKGEKLGQSEIINSMSKAQQGVTTSPGFLKHSLKNAKNAKELFNRCEITFLAVENLTAGTSSMSNSS